jgi:hypothetical protein
VVHTATVEVNEASVAPKALVHLITSRAVGSTCYASVVFSYQERSRRALGDASSVVENLGVVARCALVEVYAGRAVSRAKVAHSAIRVHARRALSSASSIQLDHVAEGATGARSGVAARVTIGAASLAISGVCKELAHGTTGLTHTVADELATLASITIDSSGAVCAAGCAVLAASISSNVSTSRAGGYAGTVDIEHAVVALHAMVSGAASIASSLAVNTCVGLSHSLRGTRLLACAVREEPVRITSSASVRVSTLGTVCCAGCTSAIGGEGPVGASSHALSSAQGVPCVALGACIGVGTCGTMGGASGSARKPKHAGQNENDDSPSGNHG